MDSKKKKYLIIAIFTIAIIFFSGTLAYWQWETSTGQQTSVTFTVENNFKCSVDGGGDITSANITLAPASCTNSKYAIKREITTDVEITGSNMSVAMDLWLDINSIDPELKNSSNFKYAITTNENSCTEGYINGGTFSGNEAILLNDKIYSKTKEEKFYLYVWLDAEETNSNTQNKTFSLSLNGNCTSGNFKPNEPVLEDGMIPITLSSMGIATVADTNDEWYNYEEKEWANAVLVNENATTGVANSHSREYYLKNPGTQIASEDILAYYVWIPRYKYKVWVMDKSYYDEKINFPRIIDIVFESSDTLKSKAMKVGDYHTHPAFTFGNTELDGFWVGKFDTSHESMYFDQHTEFGEENVDLACSETSCEKAFGLRVKPDVTSLVGQNLSNFFYASRFMSSSGNPYGLDASKTDTHMMKNSEWGAVVYLLHSFYGQGNDIYSNNSEYFTGRSGGLGGDRVRGSTYGSYTWVGQSVDKNGLFGEITDSSLGTKASTTGNVYGVYDIKGGMPDYVMSFYGNSLDEYEDTGFNVFPDNKYFDTYSKDSFPWDEFTNDDYQFLGHALYEIINWYDIGVEPSETGVVFCRGVNASNFGSDGELFYVTDCGGVAFYVAFRSVIAKGD